MGMNMEAMWKLMTKRLGAAYEESERTGEPFSVSVEGRASTYHPSTCRCGCGGTRWRKGETTALKGAEPNP